jgi:hypothetical protein
MIARFGISATRFQSRSHGHNACPKSGHDHWTRYIVLATLKSSQPLCTNRKIALAEQGQGGRIQSFQAQVFGRLDCKAGKALAK